ncbi:IS30 family transposase [Staphylococcus pettenkoferi]|uniref:IS30 family transposase n=1 Tax=Staphylococcus pettenkoferi TaxID=170573 RepID=UPI00066CA090|nr:IS30 family transposase [Staphylococcus pettenkoferi]
MMQTHCNTKPHKGTHLSYGERERIKAFHDCGLSNREIARRLGRAPQTINNEIERGQVYQVKQRQNYKGKVYEYGSVDYKPERAHYRYKEKRLNCGPKGIRARNPEFLEWADEKMLDDHWSPEALILDAKRRNTFDDKPVPCTTTLYAWIDEGQLKTRNIHLQEKWRRRPKNKTYHRSHQRVLGMSINERPQAVETREEFGHWKIDTVIGSKDKSEPVLLTLVERKTRFEILTLIENKSAQAVTRSIRRLQTQLESYMNHIFKSKTADNGSEFSLLTLQLKDQVSVYFAHPFASWERGTSENQHKIIRRFLPKGMRFSGISNLKVQAIQRYMNNYPRKNLGGQTPSECFKRELQKLNPGE